MCRFKNLKCSKEFLRNTLDYFIKTQNYESTFQKYIGNESIGKYFNSKNTREKKLFKQHIFRYFNMFDRNSGFEIQPCSRLVYGLLIDIFIEG